MAAEKGNKRPHVLIRSGTHAEPYTWPREVRSSGIATPPRDRADHSNRLLDALRTARELSNAVDAQRHAIGIAEDLGLYLEFESSAGFELALQSLDRRKDGLELLAVRRQLDVMFATVFVAPGKLEALERLIRQYRDVDDSRWNQPKNRRLVESISALRVAVLASFWTDDAELLPGPGVLARWEVWLRVGDDRDRIVEAFQQLARQSEIVVSERVLRFAERTVLTATATREALESSIQLLDCIAELRLAKEEPSFFTRLTPSEQAEWVDELLDRSRTPNRDAPAVCILDTGVNTGHPLLRDALPPSDSLTCEPDWGSSDHQGHGTEMAGLALYGDLAEALAAHGSIDLEHRLESVKIVPPPRFAPNAPENYGAVTQEAMARAEANAPNRDRLFSMAVTAPDFRDAGRPSSWSAAIDDAVYGRILGTRRVFLVSAGNVKQGDWKHYPNVNDSDQVHDPAQAWNAVTVGTMTERTAFDTARFGGWEPLALPGGLGPSSTTSLTWRSEWPNKPDIVLEGGNAIRETETGAVDLLDDLALLTTYWRPTERVFTVTGETSAATAQAARLAAMLIARYPSLWPESVRGLLIHSATWTPEMIRAATTPSGLRTNLLLRRFGYGVPNLERATWSASNVLTLIAQEELRPFEKRGTVKSKDMNVHALPWPQQQLMELGDTRVSMRVTLSYFIEPNPAERGRNRKFRYQSLGLRFAIRTPTESLDEFRARVSKDAQTEENDGAPSSDPGWFIGPQQRTRGSIHSDIWEGLAADLAERGHVAVYPVGGWWKERQHLERWRERVRYSLIVSIVTPETGVDIYTPVAVMVEAEVATVGT